MAFRRAIVSLAVHSQASYGLHRAATSPPTLKPPPPPSPTLSCPVTVPCCSFAAVPHHVKEVFKDNEDDAGPRLNNDITAIFLRLITDEVHDIIPRYKALQIAVRMGLDLVEIQWTVVAMCRWTYTSSAQAYRCLVWPDHLFSQTNFDPGLPSALDITAQSQECLEKVAKTVSFLARPEGSFLLLLIGEVQKDRALELLNVRPFYFVYLCGVKT
ncbi:N(6)-adenine-specific DNA methyltransferase 2 [Hordeum vulgare]|nr:N(6)-adenine-specific DNA methyltransferase 2 [Hordeum vulgare]